MYITKTEGYPHELSFDSIKAMVGKKLTSMQAFQCAHPPLMITNLSQGIVYQLFNYQKRILVSDGNHNNGDNVIPNLDQSEFSFMSHDHSLIVNAINCLFVFWPPTVNSSCISNSLPIIYNIDGIHREELGAYQWLGPACWPELTSG